MRKHLTISMTALTMGLGFATLTPLVTQAQVSIGISVGFAPPSLPIYEQPPIPGYGYFWTPGYWAWDEAINDYYWVPGTWVQPPRIGYLWTPAYWGWSGGRYSFYNGYWGPQVGFYGGINYGFGYGGNGYDGGYWRGNHLYYNRYVNNISRAHITTVYNKVIVRNSGNRISYAGGVGGTHARPSSRQLTIMHGVHVGPTPIQVQHRDMADKEPSLRAGVNHGAPPVAATPSPGRFKGADIAPAQKAPVTSHPTTPAERTKPAGQPRQPAPPHATPAPVHQGQQARLQQRPAFQQQPRPQQQQRQAPQPQFRPQQEQRQAPQQQPRFLQQQRQAPQLQPGPQQQQRQAPQQEARPQQQDRQREQSGPGPKPSTGQ